MKNSDVLYLTSRTLPARTQKSSKNENVKESKLNKNILIAKTLEAFKPKAKFFFPLQLPISKICSKPIFVSEIGPVLDLQDLRNFHWPSKID